MTTDQTWQTLTSESSLRALALVRQGKLEALKKLGAELMCIHDSILVEVDADKLAAALDVLSTRNEAQAAATVAIGSVTLPAGAPWRK